MVKINSTILLFFLAVLVIVLWIFSAVTNTRLEQTIDEHYQTKQIVEKITKLKNEWENSAQSKNRVDRFISNTKELEPAIKKSGKITKIELKNAPLDLIKKLSNEILIYPVIIRSIEVIKKDESSVDLMLEVSE